jgi:hypothetical protein
LHRGTALPRPPSSSGKPSQTRRLRVHFGPNRPILRPFALSTPEVHRMHKGFSSVPPVCIRCTSGVHALGASPARRVLGGFEPPRGRVAQVVHPVGGRARLSERAVGGGPDPHVSESFSPTRRARRDAPYLGAAWATRPHVGCYTEATSSTGC